MIVLSVHGYPIDTGGSFWRLSGEYSIRFDLARPPSLDADDWRRWLDALRDYMRACIRALAPQTVLTRHSNILAVLRNAGAMGAMSRGGPRVLGAMYDALRGPLPGRGGEKTGLAPGSASRYLANWRRFYLWCCDESDVADVDPDVANSMRDVSLNARAGNPGRAILRLDPVDGPIPEGLARRLDRAIVAMAYERALDIPTAVSGLVFLRFGCNAEHLRRLEGTDFRTSGVDGRPCTLAIPRIKKHVGAGRRDAFKVRDVDPELAGLIAELIAENRRVAPPDPEGDRRFGRPLFRRAEPATHLVDTTHEDGAFRVPRNWFLEALARISRAVADTLPVGRLTPRRLRYTFATRMVLKGVSPLVLMELLDHSDLKNVLVYFNAGLGVVQHLDRTVGPAIASIVEVLQGRASADTLQGLPGLRRPEREALPAPAACLSCSRFRPCSAPALLAVADRLERSGRPDRVAEDRALAATARVAASFLDGRTAERAMPETVSVNR